MVDPKSDGSSDGSKAFWWVMGIVSILLTAGVVGAIATFAQVGRLDTNVTLLRREVQRDQDAAIEQVRAVEARLTDRVRALEAKFDAYYVQTQGGGR